MSLSAENDRSDFDDSPVGSPKFQTTVQHIPTPAPHERPPRYDPFILHFWLVSVVSVVTILLGIALEVALFMSDRQNGFPVPTQGVFSFVPTQTLMVTLKFLFHTLLFVPIAYFWEISDWNFRWYQPYVALSEGNAPASQSILLDYIASNRFAVLYNSLTHKHLLITASAFIALGAMFFQPLASSIFQARLASYQTDATAVVTNSIALSPTIDDLNAFFASTGFALASVYDNPVDPPFVNEEWTAETFQAPPHSPAYLNGSLAVTVTATQTNVNCVTPSSLNVVNTDGSYVASATFPGGCTAGNVFNPGNGTQQYSVTNASSCASSNLDITFQPVVFWFYLNASSPQVASVYCNPTLKTFIVETSMNLTSGVLGPCTPIQEPAPENNVTGSLQDGHPYNGVVFSQSNDFFVSSRARAINFGIPDAIFRYAVQQPGGPSSVFQDPYGFLNATELIYTLHLAVAAQANYFQSNNTTIRAQLTFAILRLFVVPLPTHVLSCLLVVIGIVGLVVHFLHNRVRRGLWLTSPPGSIAAIVSLTSQSDFGKLLLPYDDQEQMENHLSGLSFSLDPLTGAIVAEENDGATDSKYADGIALLGRKRQGASF